MPWKPGESGNPLGRPKGAQNKFSEIKRAFSEVFERLGGAEGLLEWIAEQPRHKGDFYKLLAGMMPRDLNLETYAVDHRRSASEYSTGELVALIQANREAPEANEPKVITWPKSDRKQGEPPRQDVPVVLEADMPSASHPALTGPVDGEA